MRDSSPVAANVHVPVAMTDVVLDHERLDCYRVAVALDAAVVALVRCVPRGHGWLVDQALRASASAALNLSEALGRQGADRARALRIARGSALELDTALTLLAHRCAVAAQWRATARTLTVRLVAMLVRLGQVATST